MVTISLTLKSFKMSDILVKAPLTCRVMTVALLRVATTSTIFASTTTTTAVYPKALASRKNSKTPKKFHDPPFGSSLESSSLDDSGLGTGEKWSSAGRNLANTKPALSAGSCPESASGPEDESDFLETLLDRNMEFESEGKSAEYSDGAELLHFDLSGVESDEPSETFQNRSSFTTSAQMFYKMISVDSDNGELDPRATENSDDRKTNLSKTSDTKANDDINVELKTDSNCNLKVTVDNPVSLDAKFSNSDPETFKLGINLKCNVDREQRNTCRSRKTSTPVSKHSSENLLSGSQRNINLKRKRDSDPESSIPRHAGKNINHVRMWLKRYSPRRALFHSDSFDDWPCQQGACPSTCGNTSSCDASGEYTSSSADEGNAFSAASSSFEDDASMQKSRLDSTCGSIETVLEYRRRADTGSSWARRCRAETGDTCMLPSPPFQTPPRRASNKNGGQEHFPLKTCCPFKLSYSDGDVRVRQRCDKLDKSDSVSSSDRRELTKQNHVTDPVSPLRTRHHCSLPCILRPYHSDSSAEDCFPPSSLQLSQHSDVKTSDDIFKDDVLNTSGVTSNVSNRNHSSSSDVGRRRRRRSRKKSSSSNRSSQSILQSGDSGRNRSRTLTSDPVHCSSRRRHFSQRSDFFGDCERAHLDSESSNLEGKIAPVEDLESEVYHSDLELVLDEDYVGSDLPAMLSPVESDVVLTQLEEQSTVSDQVWDGYQDMPYESEAYSESTVDEDAIRKLIEWDDFLTAGVRVRILDAADGNNNRSEASRSVAKKSTKVLALSVTRGSLSRDSDSDSEDLHHLIKDTKKALLFARSTLERQQSGDSLTPAEYDELLATCSTHLTCLRNIFEQIEIDGNKNNFSAIDLKKLKNLIEEWEILRESIEMHRNDDDQLIQLKYTKVKESIDALFTKMSGFSFCTNVEASNFKSWEELKDNLTTLQAVLTTLQETKEQLLQVNTQVHRFASDCGNYEHKFKDDVITLYQQYDDIYEQNGKQLTDLQDLDNRWRAYDQRLQSLRSKIKDSEFFACSEDCDNNSPTAEDEEFEILKTQVKELRTDAGYFESQLKDGPLWKLIDEDLGDLEKQIDKRTKSINASRTVHHPISSVTVEDDPDDRFEDAIQHQTEDSDDTDFATSANEKKPDISKAKKGSSRFWRVIRMAVPVQLALVLLYCLACYLEPNCCDNFNNFNFSFTPQLRYFNGMPPV